MTPRRPELPGTTNGVKPILLRVAGPKRRGMEGSALRTRSLTRIRSRELMVNRCARRVPNAPPIIGDVGRGRWNDQRHWRPVLSVVVLTMPRQSLSLSHIPLMRCCCSATASSESIKRCGMVFHHVGPSNRRATINIATGHGRIFCFWLRCHRAFTVISIRKLPERHSAEQHRRNKPWVLHFFILLFRSWRTISGKACIRRCHNVYSIQVCRFANVINHQKTD